MKKRVFEIRYAWNPATLEYTCEIPSFIGDGIQPPDNTTDIAPESREGFAAFWNAEAGEWKHIDDHRGKIAYQTDSGETVRIAAVGPLLENLTFLPPLPFREGRVVQWTGAEWEYVEDHRGESGYVDGVETQITELGELPEGWSLTPPSPEPTEADLLFAEQRKHAAILSNLRTAFASAQVLGDEARARTIREEYKAALAQMKTATKAFMEREK